MAQMLRKQLEEEDRKEEEAEARNDYDHKMGKQILVAWLKVLEVRSNSSNWAKIIMLNSFIILYLVF